MQRLGAFLLCSGSLLIVVAVTAAPAPVYKHNPTHWFGLAGWNKPKNSTRHLGCRGTSDKTTIVVPGGKKGDFRNRSIHRDLEGDFRMKVRVVADLRPKLPGDRSAGIFLGWGYDEQWHCELSVCLKTYAPKGQFLTRGCLRNDWSWSSRSSVEPSLKGDFLRLERRGDKFFVGVSTDGSTWTLIEDPVIPNRDRDRALWNPPKKVKVGVWAMSDDEVAFETTFDRFELVTPSK